MVQFEETTYKKFGRVMKLSTGKIEAYITLDVGPRIIKFNCKGMENILFNDDDIKRELDVACGFGEGEKWRTYGGHRMWLSPESYPLTYYPDHDPVEYKVEGEKLTVIAPEQKINKVRYTWEITVCEDDTIKILHRMKNCADSVRRCAIWGITVTDINGTAVVRQPEYNKDLLPNRVLALWPYTKMNDERLLLGESFIGIRQDPNAENAVKIGLNAFDGKLYTINKGQIFLKQFPVDHSKPYPDYGVSCEIYSNPAILEVESLGNLYDVLPGKEITHEEKWTIRKCGMEVGKDEEKIKKALEIAGF